MKKEEVLGHRLNELCHDIFWIVLDFEPSEAKASGRGNRAQK